MTKRNIEIKTIDGVGQASLFADAETSAAGVILYMDAFGLRPALDEMGERLAREGYAVLIPDLLYRFAPYGPYDAKTAFSDDKKRDELKTMIGGTSQEMSIRDTGAFLDALAEAGVTGPIGTVGYCMGGSRALNAAAAFPDRIVAAASFHGGNLGGEAPDTPAANAAKMKARVYVGVAGIDNSFPPEQSARLAKELRVAEVDHVIENYAEMKHGWTISDHGVYDEAGAERHWKRLTTFFAETIG